MALRMSPTVPVDGRFKVSLVPGVSCGEGLPGDGDLGGLRGLVVRRRRRAAVGSEPRAHELQLPLAAQPLLLHRQPARRRRLCALR